MVVRARFRHGVKSYEIVDWLFSRVFPNRGGLVVVDTTYGVGRFYRLARRRIGLLVGVDVERYEWEVEPDIFYQVPCQVFVGRVLSGEIALPPRVDLVVVDPPWSHEKRGVFAKRIGVSNMPYHLPYVDSVSIVQSAMRLSKYLGTPLLYRYKERLGCEHLVEVEAEVFIVRNRGIIHYGICIA